MEEFISKLPKDALPVLEMYLSRLVSGIQKRPDFVSMAEVIFKRADDRFSAMDANVSKAVALVTAGTMTEPQALAWICQQPPHVARELVSLAFSKGLHRARALRRAERNTTIALMTRGGYSNKEISEEANCSHATAAKQAAKSKRKDTSCPSIGS